MFSAIRHEYSFSSPSSAMRGLAAVPYTLSKEGASSPKLRNTLSGEESPESAIKAARSASSLKVASMPRALRICMDFLISKPVFLCADEQRYEISSVSDKRSSAFTKAESFPFDTATPLNSENSNGSLLQDTKTEQSPSNSSPGQNGPTALIGSAFSESIIPSGKIASDVHTRCASAFSLYFEAIVLIPRLRRYSVREI